MYSNGEIVFQSSMPVFVVSSRL